MKIIGIDPGEQGAIAVLNSVGAIALLEDMPLTPDGKNISISRIRRLILDAVFDKSAIHKIPDEGFIDDVILYIENVQAMQFKDKATGEVRSQSTASFGTYKEHVGYLLGFCHAIGLRYRQVHSKQWQPVFGVRGKQVGYDSISACLKLFPNTPLIEYGARGAEKRKNGRSDALLIAEYGRRQVLGEEGKAA